MKPVLELRGLRAFYGRTCVLNGIDLDVHQGEAVALLGANGAAKTTTLRAISRLVRTEGAIRVQGEDVVAARPDRIARLGVAHVPDGRGTFAQLTVRENLVLGGHLGRNSLPLAAAIDRVCDYFPALPRLMDRQAGMLSGGEQQMLAIARALMLQPTLLLLDEPSFGLAPRIVKDVFKVLQRIRRQEQVSILIVEQNSRLALQFADRAYLLQTGRVVMSGDAATLRDDPAIQRAYLGV